MQLRFSMDGIKNMDLLYTQAQRHFVGFGNTYEEHYHGDDYCRTIVMDVFNSLSSSDWANQKYLGSLERIANETFVLNSIDELEYNISFAIKTYNRETARLEITITAPETNSYDQKLEDLKIALKNRLISDWQECTWLMDEQAAALCKEVYEKIFTVENDLRAFASKVLIHFLGVNWIKRAGLEKEAESVNNLKKKFIQRVPEFDNINTDFLSMTLETLVGVMFEGVIYNDDIVLNQQDYFIIQQIAAKSKVVGSLVTDYIKNRRIKYKAIWDDLFVPYIDNPDAFKAAVHNFIEDRNHVAHSKVLSRSAYRVIVNDFDAMLSFISSADSKFESEETADEVLQTWEAEYEAENEREHYRYLIENDTGIHILDDDEIKDWFDEVLDEFYNNVYQQYHFDVCYDISDFSTPDKDGVVFSISSSAVDNNCARIDLIAEYFIDDDLGQDSICIILANDGVGNEICRAEICFHNGDGYEGEDGLMEATNNSEYYTSELEYFREKIFAAIETLNPYPAKLDALSYESKGAVQFVADFPCEQCGQFGISINENFLSIGRCCYCGYENELMECQRCGELVDADSLKYGFCPSCSAYIDKQ